MSTTASYQPFQFNNPNTLKYGVFFYSHNGDDFQGDVSFYTDDLEQAKIDAVEILEEFGESYIYCEIYEIEANGSFGVKLDYLWKSDEQ